MRSKWILTTLLGLALGLALLTGGDTLQAQTTPPVVTGTPYPPVPSAFTYQGRLTDGAALANGAYDFQFALYNDETDGWQVAPAVTREGVSVNNGLFTVRLDFGLDYLGQAVYLQVGVRPAGSAEAFTPLTPRQPLSATPYALALPGLRTQPNWESPNVIGGYKGNAVAPGVIGATTAGGGEGGRPNQVLDAFGVIGGGGGNQAGNASDDTTDAMYATVSGGESNGASGQWATVGGGRYNWAKDYNATVAGGQDNRAEAPSATIAGGFSNHATGWLTTIGGGNLNSVSAQGATVAGGIMNTAVGENASVGGGTHNAAEGVASTVSGGLYNAARKDYGTVAGGEGNVAFETHASVGGGFQNGAADPYATTSGGANNITYGQAATVGGGYGNRTSGDNATVGGGKFNQAISLLATIPGGLLNTAEAPYSLAAGSRAHASHPGALLLADGSGCQGETCAYEFASVAANEFAVRATGGVRLVSAVDNTGRPTAGVKLSAGAGAWSTLSDRQAKTDFVPVDAGALLDALAQMPITTWRYKTEASGARHVGPTAQDFQAAFGLGSDNTTISTVDTDGVALAAAQALYARTQRLEAELAEAQATNAQLAARLSDVETRLARLEGQTPPAPAADHNLALLGLALVGGTAFVWGATRRSRPGGEP